MKRYFFSTIFLFFLVLNFSDAQKPDDWVRLKNQNASLPELQAAFNAYWDGKSYVKGYGWKQFKRFEHFWSTRVDEKGNFPTRKTLQDAYAGFESLKNNSANRAPNAASWYPKGPTGVSYGNGRINFIEVDPNNSNTIYIGSPSGGCWKTTNAGQNWEPLTDFLSTVSVSGIAVDPNNSNNVLINTGDFNHTQGYSHGIFRSTNGGQTWNTTSINYSSPSFVRGGKIEFVPGSSTNVFAISHSGMYRSTNGGQNWTTIVSGSVEDFEFKPGTPSTMYYVNDNRFYKSTNGGVSFSLVTSGLPFSGFTRLQVAVTPANPNVVYVLAGGSGSTLVYKSTNSGASFSQMHTASTGDPLGNQVWYDMAFAVSPTNENDLHIGAVYVYRSQDGGATFSSALNSGIHPDIHWLEYFGNYLYCGNDGGIHRSLTGGSSWENLIGDMEITQFYKFSSAVTDTSQMTGGAQDNGTYIHKNNNWSRIGGGDGMDNQIDYTDKYIIYASYQNGSFYRTMNGGTSSISIFTNVTESGGWVTPMEIDPNVPTTIYAGYDNVWKSTDRGATSVAISNFGGMGKLDIVKVAPSNSNIIYASDGFNVRKTINGGTSWSTVSLPNTVTSIEIHHTNPDIVWVTLSNYSSGNKIYKSTNGGLSWTNISGNLPNFPANTVVHHDWSANDDIYIGMDYGVYFLNNNSGTTWQLYMTGLPNVTISELEIPYGSNVLRAGTFGRGIWESPVHTNATLPVLPPQANGFANEVEICPGEDITFTNASTQYNTISWMFPGGTPATSTAQMPTVNYANSGTYDVTIIATNTGGSDTLVLQNYIDVSNPTASLDLQEGFDGGIFPTDWDIENPDGDKTWGTFAGLGGFGINTGCAFINNYSYSGPNVDYFYTPAIDLSQYTGTSLSFDVAYAPHSTAKSDTMAVYYSNDCGVTLHKIWEKGGLDLSTTGTTFALSFSPSASEWRTETVNLSGLSLPALETKFYFENRGYNGNNLFVDNINITGSTITGSGPQATTVLASVNVYPNPAKEGLHVDVTGLENHTIIIYDISGKMVLERSNAKQKELINIQTLSAGVYNIKIVSEQGVFNKKFMKN
ncbi:MAG: T9SS type A sorting domain-containing protein [Aureispira sp.]|nr:T9SS type A sorting domain-containing protein [Aureispira sp.]